MPITEKIKVKFNLWLQRDLTLKDRTLLSTAEVHSKLNYLAISLDINKKYAKTLIGVLLILFGKIKPIA